jgi:hypothetical protein
MQLYLGLAATGPTSSGFDSEDEEASDSEDEEASDSDSDEEKTPPPPATICERAIFGAIGTGVTEIKDSIEDRLFKTNMTPTQLLHQVANDPLHSYIAKMTEVTCTSVRNYVYNHLSGMENDKNSRLTIYRRFESKFNESNVELGKVRRALEVAEAAYNAVLEQVNFHEQLVRDLSKVAEEQASVHSRLEKDQEVSATCFAVMTQIMEGHACVHNQQMLPYARVKTTKDIHDLATAFGVRDYASTDLATRKHLDIARALKFLGYELSPANKERPTKYRILKTNKSTSKEEMRAQTCSCFGIKATPTPALDTKPHKKRLGRADEAPKSPKRRKIKPDEAIILLASNPVLQAAVVRQMAANAAVDPATDQQPTDDNQDQKPAASANGPN